MTNPWPHYKNAPLLGYSAPRFARPTEEIKSCNVWLRQSTIFRADTRSTDAVDQAILEQALYQLLGSDRPHLAEY